MKERRQRSNEKDNIFNSFKFILHSSIHTTISINVRAYIDPSVMTYAIQAIAGIAIAIGAAVGIYFRKIRKKVNEKLGVDENKNKEVETDEIMMK